MDDRALVDCGAVVLADVRTPHAGMTDAPIVAQTAEHVGLLGLEAGALGNRLLRTLDGRRVVNVACVEREALYVG